MDSNDIDVDQMLRARNNGSAFKAPFTHDRPSKSSASSSSRDLDEHVPLLNDEESVGGDNEQRGSGEEPEWFGTAELQGLPWWNRPSIYWLLPPFLLFTMAFGATVVPKLNLIIDLVCDEYYASQDPDPISGPVDPGQQPDRCQANAVSARASLFLLYANLCSGILSAITSPKLGALSDQYGRKKLLILTTSGVFVGEILTILAAKYPETVHVNWILVGYAFDGLCGSFIIGMAIAHAYASDCTPPHKRNVAFGYFHACLFTGIAVGPVLAGYVIEARKKYVGKTEAVLLVFYLALLFHGIFILVLAFTIPESLSKARQQAARDKHYEEMERLGPAADWVNQLRSINLFAPLKVLWPTGRGSSPAVRRNLILLAATDTLTFGVSMGAMGVIVVYMRTQFDWQELESGRFVSIVNASRVIALLVGLPLLSLLIKGKKGTEGERSSGSDRFDLFMIRGAIFFDTLGFLGYTLSRDGTLFTISGMVAAIGGIASPTLGSALTKHVPPDQVGQVLGATGLLHAFARVLAPTIFNGIFSATVGTYRQTVFVCLTATFALAFLCSWFIKPHVYLEHPEPDNFSSRSSDASDD